MPKRKSMNVLNAKIMNMRSKIIACKEKYDKLCAELLRLEKEKKILQAQHLFDKFEKSNKTFQEVMTFLER